MSKSVKSMILNGSDRIQSKLERIRIHRMKRDNAFRQRFVDEDDDVDPGIKIVKPFYMRGVKSGHTNQSCESN